MHLCSACNRHTANVLDDDGDDDDVSDVLRSFTKKQLFTKSGDVKLGFLRDRQRRVHRPTLQHVNACFRFSVIRFLIFRCVCSPPD